MDQFAVLNSLDHSKGQAIKLPNAIIVIAILTTVGAMADEPSKTQPVQLLLPDTKPFQRAMIMPGMGPDGILYLGVFDAAVDAGVAPDLLIATSGGGIAAGLILAFPNRNDRNEFLKSRSFHEMMLSIEVDQGDPNRFAAKIPGWYLQSLGLCDKSPRLNERTLVRVPPLWNEPAVNQPFPSDGPGPRVIVVSTRLEASPEANRHGIPKRFRECWITDENTARHLDGSRSPIARAFPKSTVCEQVAVLDQMLIGQSVRSTLAEPYIFNPLCYEGHAYIGGFMDLFPLELANSLANETFLAQLHPIQKTFATMFRGLFRFDINERREFVDQSPVALRVDLRDKDECLKNSSFWFRIETVSRKADIQAVPDPSRETDERFLLPRRTLVDGVPEDHATFVRMLDAQYSWGYRRTIQAIRRAKTTSNPSLQH